MVNYNDGFYEYAQLTLQGWTGGFTQLIGGIPPATYVVELVDSSGQSWGKSPPVAIPDAKVPPNPWQLALAHQLPTVLFTHYDGQVGSWAIDPATQDADPATDEITVTNLLGEDVVVERCLVASGSRTSCTPVGTVAPEADIRTVETLTPSTSAILTLMDVMSDHQALFIHPASDATQLFQRDLFQSRTYVGSCEIERILVHGARPSLNWSGYLTPIALSSCTGYGSSGS